MSDRDDLGSEENAFLRAMNRGPSPKGQWKRVGRDAVWFLVACAWSRVGFLIAAHFGLEENSLIDVVLFAPLLIAMMRLFRPWRRW